MGNHCSTHKTIDPDLYKHSARNWTPRVPEVGLTSCKQAALLPGLIRTRTLGLAPQQISLVLKSLSACLSALANVFQNAYSLCKTGSRWTEDRTSKLSMSPELSIPMPASPAQVHITDRSSYAFLQREIHQIRDSAVGRLSFLDIFILKLKKKNLMKTGNLKIQVFSLLPS